MSDLAILICIFYGAGDIVLYRRVLGYRFSTSTWRLAIAVLCGGVFAVLPAFSHLGLFQMDFLIQAVMVSFMSVFLFQKLQVGLAFFVYLSRQILFNFLDGILRLCASSALYTEGVWPQVALVLNLFWLILLVVLSLYLQKKEMTIAAFFQDVHRGYVWLADAFLLLPATSIFWGTASVENIRVAEAMSMVKDAFLGFLMIGMILLALVLREKKRQLEAQIALNERCMQEQTAQYHLLDEKQKELRAFRHDISGHLITLEHMAEKQELSELKNYLQGLQGIQEEAFCIFTDNIVSDAIFNAYYGRGKKEGVSFEVLGKFDRSLTMTETDLCIVLTNLVNNAYEAAAQCQGEKYVLIEIGQSKGLTFLTITNTTQGKAEIISDSVQTTKADKTLHGLGIANTVRVLKRYDGTIDWHVEEGKVTTEVVI